DGTLRRQVALKFLRTHLPRAGLAERLARERDILASLIHANIARLYDAGVSADGLPYLALEYIEGRQIDAYCREEALDTRGRLGLFLQVARAVAYAHGKLVVHRDLKPANILVSADAQVHLLDFGIAKLLEDGRAVETHLTQLAGRAFTPEYASPEQIRGEPVTTASDIYSLGVVLYELLTDTRPYTLKRNSRGALEDAILESEPRRPSDCAADPDTRRALRGDVDAVVLKALKKAPEERYATVNAFAEDVERLLTGLPVTAQPDSVAYRLRRFVARNKLGVAAATVVVLAVLGGAIVALWQARVALQEKRRAEEVRSFIESIFIDADPAGTSGRPLSAVELLRQANARVATLRTTDPEQRLELLNTLALAMINLRDLEGAEAVLRDALAQAAALESSSLPALRAHRLRARLHVARSEPELAQRELGQVIPRLMQRPQRHVEELLAAMLVSTEAYNAHADYEGALTSARDMIDTGRNLGVERSADLVAGLIQLSYAHDYLNQHPQALDASRRAYEMSRALFPDASAHPVVNGARMQYAVALVRADDAARGLELMREAEREAMAVFGPDSRIAAEIAFKMNQYLGRGGFVKEEIATIRKAMRILGPDYSPDSLAYAALLDNLGGSYLSVRDAARSLPASTRAREIVVAQLGERHESAFVIQVARARALAMLGDTAQALQLLRPIVANYEGGPGVNSPLHFLGFATRLHGEAAEAAKMQERVLSNVTARRQ
ncbi:MAG TPA: serine/threonine-protein kinase, partial [Steroidobacteraceae bacterium]|nr:serine/threonine-protein kinase [Steroidobacteraceae bacterium]